MLEVTLGSFGYTESAAADSIQKVVTATSELAALSVDISAVLINSCCDCDWKL